MTTQVVGLKNTGFHFLKLICQEIFMDQKLALWNITDFWILSWLIKIIHFNLVFIISSQIAIKPFPGLRMLMEEDTSHNKNFKNGELQQTK